MFQIENKTDQTVSCLLWWYSLYGEVNVKGDELEKGDSAVHITDNKGLYRAVWSSRSGDWLVKRWVTVEETDVLITIRLNEIPSEVIKTNALESE
jgi:hypothetical protein